MTPEQQMAAGDKATELVDVALARAAAQQVPPTQPQTQQLPMPKEPPVEKAAAKPAPRKADPPPPTSDVTRVILPEGYDQPAPGPAGRAAGPQQSTAPVVGFLVVVDGPGKGNYRAVYNGSNTIGRNQSQRIPIDFGDDTISGEQQAFLVYDGRTRQFQLVPNLGRPNLVHLNDQALLTNAVLKMHDKVTMGRTTLLFVPLCDQAFDWADVA